MIKAICFDLDGVYFTSAGFSSFKQSIVDLGVDYKDVEFILHKEPMNLFKAGKTSESNFWNQAKEMWKLDISVEELMNMLPRGYVINPEVHEVVKKVRRNGYKTCICSNNFITRINKLQEKFNFLNDFDTAVFSYEVGILKPDVRIYQELLKRVDVRPEELAYSDDGLDKLKGALDLGIKAFLYEDFDQFKEKLIDLGVNL